MLRLLSVRFELESFCCRRDGFLNCATPSVRRPDANGLTRIANTSDWIRVRTSTSASGAEAASVTERGTIKLRVLEPFHHRTMVRVPSEMRPIDRHRPMRRSASLVVIDVK
jgi:hypothetical protein